MTFRAAFSQTDVAACLETGLQALGPYRSLIVCADRSSLQGSVDIDRCLAARYPQDHRWDYSFGYSRSI